MALYAVIIQDVMEPPFCTVAEARFFAHQAVGITIGPRDCSAQNLCGVARQAAINDTAHLWSLLSKHIPVALNIVKFTLILGHNSRVFRSDTDMGMDDKTEIIVRQLELQTFPRSRCPRHEFVLTQMQLCKGDASSPRCLGKHSDHMFQGWLAYKVRLSTAWLTWHWANH